MISIKLLLQICFRKKKIYLKSKNVTKKLVQFYETKPAFIYSLDQVIQIVKEKYSILNILKPSVCDVLSSISSNAKPIQYLPNRFKVLAWKVKSQAFCCMCIYIQYIHKILPSNFLAASLSTVMTSRRQLEYHIGTAQPPNWRHWQIVCTTSMAVLCECEKFRHRKFYVRVLTDNQEKRPLHFGL